MTSINQTNFVCIRLSSSNMNSFTKCLIQNAKLDVTEYIWFREDLQFLRLRKLLADNITTNTYAELSNQVITRRYNTNPRRGIIENDVTHLNLIRAIRSLNDTSVKRIQTCEHCDLMTFRCKTLVWIPSYYWDELILISPLSKPVSSFTVVLCFRCTTMAYLPILPTYHPLCYFDLWILLRLLLNPFEPLQFKHNNTVFNHCSYCSNSYSNVNQNMQCQACTNVLFT